MVTQADVLRALRELDSIGEVEFLRIYANGFGSRTTWIVHDGVKYSIKAIWAASHHPAILTTTFTTHEAKRPLKQMGFEIVDDDTEQSKIVGNAGSTYSVSFSAFCKSLGFPLKNVRWSWCALHESESQALFTVWDNEIEPDGSTYLFWDGNDERRTDHGRRELKRMLDDALDNELVVYGIKCAPTYPLTSPRKRSSFDRNVLLVLSLRREGRDIRGTILGTIACDAIRQGFSELGSAIDDLDAIGVGNEQPSRTDYSGSFIIRDDRVRQIVVKRANGRCEHCGELGFRKTDGSYYVEAHHIISLSKQGPDTLDNVIALCPNHHREAHFGEFRLALETRFLEHLARLRASNQLS